MNPVMEIIAPVKSLNIQMERHGDKLRLITPAVYSPPDDLVAKLKSHKQELLNYLDS